MLAGMAGGAFVMQVAHAQTEPPVYFVGEIDVTNPEGYAKEYLRKAREIIKAHGGQLIAAGGAGGAGNQVVAVDGEPPKRVVIYRYPSTDAVYAWRHDPGYEEVRKIGEKCAKYRTFAVEGIAR
jgi:uncharacterized protein (DUF1330 family)